MELRVHPPTLAHQLMEENRGPEWGVISPGSHSRQDSTIWTLPISLAPSSSGAIGVGSDAPLGALGSGSGKPMSPSQCHQALSTKLPGFGAQYLSLALEGGCCGLAPSPHSSLPPGATIHSRGGLSSCCCPGRDKNPSVTLSPSLQLPPRLTLSLGLNVIP